MITFLAKMYLQTNLLLPILSPRIHFYQLTNKSIYFRDVFLIAIDTVLLCGSYLFRKRPTAIIKALCGVSETELILKS